MRGFQKGKIGPIDGTDHVGGNYATAVNFEASFPKILPDSSGADIGLFLDFGNVWGVDYDDTIDNSNKIRSSTGLAINWQSPLGPMSFVLSNNLSKADSDKTESFKSSAVLANFVERFLTRRPPEEDPELDFIELIIIRIGIAIAKATVIAFNKKIKYSNKISIIQIKRLTTVPVRQEASVAAKRALKAIFNNVPRMSGQIAERPPSKIPTLEIFAKPQIP